MNDVRAIQLLKLNSADRQESQLQNEKKEVIQIGSSGWQKMEKEIEIYWIGSFEECDLCHEIYPMAWIEFNGRQFLCLACRSEYENN